MPQVMTLRFGPLECDAERAIEFPCGLPGFDRERRFTLVEPAALAPLVFLQSLVTPELCLPAVAVGVIDPQYQLDVAREDLETLELEDAAGRDVLCLAIVVAPPDGPPSANLLAPVVINLSRRVGVQTVRTDTRYSHRHLLARPAPEHPEMDQPAPEHPEKDRPAKHRPEMDQPALDQPAPDQPETKEDQCS